MIIKILPYAAVEPQRPGDLARLLRYLFAAQTGEQETGAHLRLAGPPVTRRVVQRHLPWGLDARNAATDLAHQMFAFIRAGWTGGGRLPRRVYSHIVISYSPKLSRRAGLGSTVRSTMGSNSVHSKAVHIALDALENLGVGEHFPMIVVPHGDRQHLHVHIVLALMVAGSPACKLPERNSSTLRSIARHVAGAYGLPAASRLLNERHKAAVHGCVAGTHRAR
ncbi:relaxase/mobilization nuclease domain-containing protein [Methylibium rhizosphaerae]|uniref:relaxase/mobilization nuclease domain-containing protein n=1 Tax=Methylibium rhizosphaerae TaxID=2570323 RepID=UPI00112C3FAF|nr:hypothetical protein [Methylibium rhizosphaerae]